MRIQHYSPTETAHQCVNLHIGSGVYPAEVWNCNTNQLINFFFCSKSQPREVKCHINVGLFMSLESKSISTFILF